MNGRVLNTATFTKVESGSDAFAASKALGFCREEHCPEWAEKRFVLSTGGDDVPPEKQVSNGSYLELSGDQKNLFSSCPGCVTQ